MTKPIPNSNHDVVWHLDTSIFYMSHPITMYKTTDSSICKVLKKNDDEPNEIFFYVKWFVNTIGLHSPVKGNWVHWYEVIVERKTN